MLGGWVLLVQIFVATADECDQETLPEASSLIQKQLSLHDMAIDHAVHPWDKHIFVVGTHHKSGSQLLRNVLDHTFDLLGATVSCQYDGHGDSITTLNRENNCRSFPAPIRFHNYLNKDDLLHIRQEAKNMHSDLRAVMILRDPLEMVVSAYCYHHRGAEPGSIFQPGMVEMGPEEGVPEMAKRMLPVIREMVGVYEVRAPDLFVVRYENFTESPEKFDAVVERILEKFFKDEITDMQRAEIKRATRVEDLNREKDLGVSAIDYEVNHTSPEGEMDRARSCLPLIPADLYAEYVKLQEVLGYKH